VQLNTFVAIATSFSSDLVDDNFDEYVDRMSHDGEHGDHITLKTIGVLYNVNILVLSNNASFPPSTNEG
jgi:hypothetical protein